MAFKHREINQESWRLAVFAVNETDHKALFHCSDEIFAKKKKSVKKPVKLL